MSAVDYFVHAAYDAEDPGFFVDGPSADAMHLFPGSCITRYRERDAIGHPCTCDTYMLGQGGACEVRHRRLHVLRVTYVGSAPRGAHRRKGMREMEARRLTWPVPYSEDQW